MIDFRGSQFRYDPFPIGYARGVLPADQYHRLVETWPPSDLFVFKPSLGKKYSLSEVNNPKEYYDFLASYGPWRDVFLYVKSRAFVHSILAMLRDHHIDLGLMSRHVSQVHRFSGPADRARALLGKIMRLASTDGSLSTRFEFSMLPADGGCIKPHTDAPQKLITLVLSVMGEGEWDPSWGGGTDMLRPRDVTKNFNQMNRQMEFEEMEVIHTFPFTSNQCVVFVKTFNSFHSVRPMSGGNGAMRRALTINIESWR